MPTPITLADPYIHRLPIVPLRFLKPEFIVYSPASWSPSSSCAGDTVNKSPSCFASSRKTRSSLPLLQRVTSGEVFLRGIKPLAEGRTWLQKLKKTPGEPGETKLVFSKLAGSQLAREEGN